MSTTTPVQEHYDTSSVFVAVIGRPNVGKSSLTNLLVGEKVAIVTSKPQTTRTRITGILTEGATQLVFIDTPGLHRARNSLGEYMVRQVGSSVSDVDMAVLVTDASEPWEKLSRAETDLIAQFRKLRLPAVAVLNKIDLLKDKEQLIPMMAVLNEAYPFEQIVPLSAKTGDGVALLRELLDGAAVEGPHYFDDDMLTDQPERVIAAEILRDGKLPLLLGGEHLVTLGAVRAAVRKYPDLHIVHFDAHADLRDDYLGAQLSHACVLRRCHDLIGDGRIHQFCIRSGDREEFQFAARHTDMHRFDFTGLAELTDWLCQTRVPVYLTIDLDCLDPSAFPGTGTPEAGGVSFLQLLQAIRTVTKANIIGADVNELAPMLDQSGVSTATACKVLRELLLALEK